MPPLIEPWKWVVLTILQEAGGESLDGKIAVAEVIRNRMKTKYQSDGTEIGTVLKSYQFSGWNSDSNYRVGIGQLDITDLPMRDCIIAYNKAFFGGSTLVLDANLYHANWLNPFPNWTSSPKVKKITEIGKHIFYKEER